MASLKRLSVALAALVAVWVFSGGARAQVEIQNDFKYNSGQDVQPVFEGWSRNKDGTATMHFGYLNRNWVEELSIPIGPGNSMEPGGPDRGQPTLFYTRTNRNLFTVTVPKDWGKKELVWTLTANGKTEKAYGWLQPEWEIDFGGNTGARQDEESLKNKPPTIAIDPVSGVTTAKPAKVTATVTDDGLPKPAPQRKAALGQETPPILRGGPDAPVNLPQLAAGRGQAGGGGRGGQQGPTVTWIVWRGPASATFEPRVSPVKDNKTETSVTFTKPGEYVLLGRASDRQLATDQQVKVSVR